MLDVPSLEGLAIATYERLGLDPSEPVTTFRIARLLLGADAIVRPPQMLGVQACTIVVDGRRRIAVKARLPVTYALFFAGHELGHVLLEEEGYRGDDLELACDYLGAALMAPRPAMVRLHRAVGFDLEEMSRALVATQTQCALRVGEVLGLPLAVVAPTIRVRGLEEWVWPDERTLRSWARRPPSGLAKTRLTDDRRRVVLRAG